MIRFRCPGCRATITAREVAAGKQVRCPACRASVVIPPLPGESPPLELDDAEPPPDRPATRRPAQPAPTPSLFRDALRELNEQMQAIPDLPGPFQHVVLLTKVQAKLLAAVPADADRAEWRRAIGSGTEILQLWAMATGGAATSMEPVGYLMKMLGIAHAIVDRKPETPRELRKAKGETRCFVATAACGEASSEVAVLRTFRDAILARSVVGRGFVLGYERVSPPLANCLTRSAVARVAARWLVVRPAAWVARGCLRSHGIPWSGGGSG